MNFPDLLPLIVTVLVTIIGTLGTVYAKRITRRQDEATVAKLEAEAEERRVAARAGEVQIARGLLVDVQAVMDKREAEHERQTERAEADLVAVSQRLRQVEAREQQLLRAMAKHAEWERDALAALRKDNKSYPAPPPVI